MADAVEKQAFGFTMSNKLIGACKKDKDRVAALAKAVSDRLEYAERTIAELQASANENLEELDTKKQEIKFYFDTDRIKFWEAELTANRIPLANDPKKRFKPVEFSDDQKDWDEKAALKGIEGREWPDFSDKQLEKAPEQLEYLAAVARAKLEERRAHALLAKQHKIPALPGRVKDTKAPKKLEQQQPPIPVDHPSDDDDANEEESQVPADETEEEDQDAE